MDLSNTNMDWVANLAQTKVGFDSFITNLPPDPQLTARFAIVTNVSDPLSLGRVKLTFSNEGNAYETSEWVYVSNHPGGNLSTEYIGEKCICIFESGDVNKAIVVGFIPTAGRRAIGSPVKLPIVNQDTSQEFGRVPPCNESNLGSIIMLEEVSGTNQRICRRDDQGAYSWMGNNSPQVVQTNTVEAETPDQKIGDPIGQYVPGDIFVRKTCNKDQFVPYISDYSEDGNPRFRPLVSATVYHRATIPDCNADHLGSLGLIQSDPDNTFPCICGKKDGKFRWMSMDNREPIKFAENFTTLEDSSAYITEVSQKCEKPSELQDPTRDGVQKKSTSETLSPVPQIESQDDLTQYINTESFQKQIEDLLASRNADKGARDRANLLSTQLNTTALKIADNNLTQIEKLIEERIKVELKDLVDVLNVIPKMMSQIYRFAEIIPPSLSVGDKNTKGQNALHFGGLVPFSKAFRDGSIPEIKKKIAEYEKNLKKIRQDELIKPLTPGLPAGSFEKPEVDNQLVTEDYQLDETIEKDNPEGTQIGSIPYDALQEGVDSANRNIGKLLDSLGNFPDALDSIQSKAFDLIRQTVSEQTSGILDSLNNFQFSSIVDYAKTLVPTEFLDSFNNIISIDDSGRLIPGSIEQIQEGLIDLLPELSQVPASSIGSVLSGVVESSGFLLGSTSTSPNLSIANIRQLVTEFGEEAGFDISSITQFEGLLDLVDLETGQIDLSPQGIKLLGVTFGIQIPFEDAALGILGGDTTEAAQLAANIFFDPQDNKANYGELVQLLKTSDLDAKSYILTTINKLGGVDLEESDLDLNEIVQKFRDLI